MPSQLCLGRFGQVAIALGRKVRRTGHSDRGSGDYQYRCCRWVISDLGLHVRIRCRRRHTPSFVSNPCEEKLIHTDTCMRITATNEHTSSAGSLRLFGAELSPQTVQRVLHLHGTIQERHSYN
ncbi:unnamed protein product [Ectocarpus sp. 12 AP-2014]